MWFEQSGGLQWGEQVMGPGGEISVLPLGFAEFSASRRLPINGEIALRGQPIVHGGAASFLRADQARLFQAINCLHEHALIATLRNGVVTKLSATHPRVQPALQLLNALCSIDSRYAILWEIGFGLNTTLSMLPGNHAMNEVYGGSHGVLHWGLGLTPHTQYHLDFLCPSAQVRNPQGALLLGGM
jgi:hypothetical protein